ncbi:MULTISPECIES: stage V sporulation protein AB [Clostridia]|uniref:stage V sporulation protein AB n=1 Tax=Clostridium sp. CCUG 7971 TaxID=2811414 RepID=UPI001ABAD0D8|nr:stage V sporulation protein AB [Clostridium sp. CCUG 7971]MBO3445802.1 stage V sporulation protein AB [Clostridium sp. CCUG 7971]
MKLFLFIYGLSCGMMVGAGVVGILILIGIIPRMAQVSKTKEYMSLYEGILVVGTLLGSLISIQKIYINIGWIGAIIFGLAYGIFVGFLSSGLTEVLDYIPTISRRLKVPTIYLKYVIICLLIGKVIGSFVGWTIVRGGL